MRYRPAKYVLAEDDSAKTPITGYDIRERFFWLHPDGTLDLFAGFAWDGASGPTWDTPSSIRASAYHDVFCWLLREGRIDFDRWQDTVNEFFHQQCLEDGMSGWRAKYWHWAVEFADAGNPKQGIDPGRVILEAP